MTPAAWLALALLTGPARAGALSDGADAFDAGDLDRAIATWEPVVDAGRPSGKLLFDLGNAWYRKGDMARAVAYYRAAQRLRPTDGNVHHNLALARAGLDGVPDPVPAPRSWMALLTPGQLSLLAAALTMAGSVGTGLWRRSRGPWYGLAAALLGVALGLGLAWIAWDGGQAPGVAVVVGSEAVVRDAARADGGERFRLAPGSELELERELGDFYLVRDSRDRRGWVPRNGVIAL